MHRGPGVAVICNRCPAEAGAFWSCEACREAKAVYQKERRDRYRAQGRCLVCGATVAPGRRHCADHLKYYREKAK
jgi:hypothetical protein